jgi:hypothetical protein
VAAARCIDHQSDWKVVVKRLALLCGITASVAVGVMGVASAAGPPPATTTANPPSKNGIKIAAAPATVTFGQAAAIAGQVTGAGNAGVTVTLEATAFPYSSPFKVAATAVTDAAGAYRFSVSPALNTKYHAVAKASPPVTSSDVGVGVRVKVSLRVSDSSPARGQRVRFSGLVLPAHNGKVARIQRHASTGWRTVARATLTPTSAAGGVERSAYSKRIRIRAGATYRVSVNPGDGNHVTGTSPTRRLRVQMG